MISHLQKKTSLRYCWQEGIASALMLAVTDYYVIPFALFLKADARVLGLLVAFPHFISSWTQLCSVRLVKWIGSRKKMMIIGAVLQALFSFLIACLAFTENGHISLWILMLLFVLIRVVGHLIMTTWGSLVSEYLEPAERGSYLGARSQAAGIAGLIGMIGSGLLLHFAKKAGVLPWGFFTIFIIAGISRLAAAYIFSKLTDVKMISQPGSDFSFYKFIRQFRSSNFVKFVLFVSSMTFAVQLASPFYSMYLLKQMHFSYFEYMTIFVVHVVGGLIAFPVWGRHADIVGNAKVLKMTSLFIPLIPLFWILCKHPAAFAGLEFIAGFAWGGFNLCSVNYIYDAVSPEKRVRCLAYFNLINSMAFFAGASLGGVLAHKLPPLLGSSLISLFVLSFLFRTVAHWMSQKFREVRHHHEKIRSVDLFFSVVGLKPVEAKKKY